MAERLLRSIGRADLIDDPRFRTNANRVKNAGELDAIIGAFIARHTQAEAVTFFETAEVTVGPIYDVSQILEDPHFIQREIVADYPDAETTTLPMHHVVPRLLGTPGSIRARAPGLGEHNRSLLREIGVDDDAYARLLASGVVVEAAARPGKSRRRPPQPAGFPSGGRTCPKAPACDRPCCSSARATCSSRCATIARASPISRSGFCSRTTCS